MAGSAVAGAARVTARLQAQVGAESGALADAEAQVVEAVAQVVALPTADDRVVPVVAMGDVTILASDAAARRSELGSAMGRVRAWRHIVARAMEAATWWPAFASHSIARSRSRARMRAPCQGGGGCSPSDVAGSGTHGAAEGRARANGSENPRGGRCSKSRGATAARDSAHGCARGGASA